MREEEEEAAAEVEQRKMVNKVWVHGIFVFSNISNKFFVRFFLFFVFSLKRNESNVVCASIKIICDFGDQCEWDGWWCGVRVRYIVFRVKQTQQNKTKTGDTKHCHTHKSQFADVVYVRTSSTSGNNLLHWKLTTSNVRHNNRMRDRERESEKLEWIPTIQFDTETNS